MRFLMSIVALTFFLLTGFDHQEDLKIVEVHTTINESQHTITYDFKIKNTSKRTVGGKFDYPGYHHGGMEVVVVPNKELEQLMKMMKDTKYKKMEFSGFGGQGRILPNETAEFNAGYFYKNSTDTELLKKIALNGKIVVLDGTEVIAELPLK
ncbi:MAG: hypothetical protein ACQEWV_14140 [Bacillota bacterium]